MGTGGKRRLGDGRSFDGLKPVRPKLKWLGDVVPNPDETDVIRLIVDDDRWAQNEANAGYQKYVLDGVSAFVKEVFGQRRPLILSPAGFITAELARVPDATQSELDQSLGCLEVALKRCSLDRTSQHDWLVGLDGCVPEQCTPVQTVTRMMLGANVSSQHTAIKLYPEDGEKRHLVGWRMMAAQGHVPHALGRERWRSASGRAFLALVCHEAIAFSGRAVGNSSDPRREDFRSHIESHRSNRLDYVTVSAHWLGPRSSSAFNDGFSKLSESLGATVVVSMFAGANELEAAASVFAPVGGHAGRVATLLVH